MKSGEGGDEVNRVLVVGHASSNMRHLIADVTGSDATRWKVDNKYFSTLLEFCFHDCDAAVPEGPWQGVLLVFDPTSRHASAARPDFFEPWLGVAEEAAVRALVAHSPSLDELLSEPRFEAWSSWCVDNGLEFMEADMESTPHGTRAARSLLEDCEEEGAGERGMGKERLLEALASTMWPCLMRKERSEAAEEPAAPRALPAVAVKPAKIGNGAKENDDSPLTGLLPPEEEEEGDLSADVFERALTQAREMREHALTLPDEERREFASKMALQLLALMGGLEGDEGDEEDGGSQM
jgi:hypothetical protein